MKNRKNFRIKVALATVLTLGSIYIFAPWEFGLYYLSPVPDTVQEELIAATDAGIDGIIVYVDRKGSAPEFFTAGWHDRIKKIPASPQALFKIGSNRKLFDAVALAKLSAMDRLSPDDTLADHLPDLKGRIENADQITLRMMVQHESGIPNYTDQDDWDWGRSWSGDEALGLVLDKPADFEPGSDDSYSNTNYLLLRRIMSKVLGYAHGQFIRQEILAPLGLKSTFLSVKEAGSDELMSGYHVGYDLDFKELDQGFVATAEDLGTFLRALNEGTLFTEEEREIYATLYEYGHTGWVLGHSSRAHYHPDIDAVVVQFTSTTGNDTVLLTRVVYDRVVGILRERN